MGSPGRAGDIGSGPQAAQRGRAMRASLYRMAPVRPHGDKRVTVAGIFIAPWGHSQLHPPFSTEAPFDAICAAPDAGDMLAHALVEHALRGHQLAAESLDDHGEEA